MNESVRLWVGILIAVVILLYVGITLGLYFEERRADRQREEAIQRASGSRQRRGR